MNRPTPLMYSPPSLPVRGEDPWAAAHAKLVTILLHTPLPQRYAAARDFCQEQARLSPADAFDWQAEAEHWQAQLERVQHLEWDRLGVVPDEGEELPF